MTPPRKPGRPLTHRPTVRLHAHVRLATRLALIERAGGPCKIGVLLDQWAEAATKARAVTPFEAKGVQSKRTPQPYPLPVIHLNGTGAQTLFDSYEVARTATIFALRAFEAVEFNGRDYYPIHPDAYGVARAQRQAMAQKLDEVAKYLLAHLIHIGDRMPETGHPA